VKTIYTLLFFIPSTRHFKSRFLIVAVAMVVGTVFGLDSYAQSIITTVAGNPNLTGQDAETVGIYPCHIATDPDGNCYFCTHNQLYKVAAATGKLSLVAGNSHKGYSGDGGLAIYAEINPGIFPGIAVDAIGNVYITDGSNNRIRKISVNGIITTIAGNGNAGYSGDGGSATSASLNDPAYISIDAFGSLYIADARNHCVRKVSAEGVISTVAGNGSDGYSGDGGLAINAELHLPYCVAVDSYGNLYILESNERVRKVSTKGIISTNMISGFSRDDDSSFATNTKFKTLDNLAVDALGNLFVVSQRDNCIYKISTIGTTSIVAGNGTIGYGGDGGQATHAQIKSPTGVAIDALGNLYFVDCGNNRIRKVSTSGVISTIAGNGTSGYDEGGWANYKQSIYPSCVGVDASGNLYIESFSDILKVSTSGIVSKIIENKQLIQFRDFVVDSAGNLYIADFSGHRILKVSAYGSVSIVAGNGTYGYSGDAGLAVNAQFKYPSGIAADVYGNLYIADRATNCVRKISASGIITTVAGNGQKGYSGDDGLATNAELNIPSGVAVDTSGNLYIVDEGNNRIRKVFTNGVISTVAGNGRYGYSGDGGQAVNAALALTVTGTMGYHIAVDASGNLYIPNDNDVIRMVSANGIISTVAGNGTKGYSGDGALSTTAQLSSPNSVAVDAYGNLYISDQDNEVIRKVTFKQPHR
jgi:sugar lactone lactonase YvrE